MPSLSYLNSMGIHRKSRTPECPECGSTSFRHRRTEYAPRVDYVDGAIVDIQSRKRRMSCRNCGKYITVIDGPNNIFYSPKYADRFCLYVVSIGKPPKETARHIKDKHGHQIDWRTVENIHKIASVLDLQRFFVDSS